MARAAPGHSRPSSPTTGISRAGAPRAGSWQRGPGRHSRRDQERCHRVRRTERRRPSACGDAFAARAFRAVTVRACGAAEPDGLAFFRSAIRLRTTGERGRTGTRFSRRAASATVRAVPPGGDQLTHGGGVHAVSDQSERPDVSRFGRDDRPRPRSTGRRPSERHRSGKRPDSRRRTIGTKRASSRPSASSTIRP